MPSTSKRLVIEASVDFREKRKWERGPRSGRRRRQQGSGRWCPFGGLLDVRWSVRAGKCTKCHERGRGRAKSVGWKRKRKEKDKIGSQKKKRRRGKCEREQSTWVTRRCIWQARQASWRKEWMRSWRSETRRRMAGALRDRYQEPIWSASYVQSFVLPWITP